MSKIVASTFNTEEVEGQIKVFNAQGSASNALKDVQPGEVLEVTDVLVYEDKIDSYGQDSEGLVTVLFTADENGEQKLFGSVSAPISDGAKKLIQFMDATGRDSVDVSINKSTSKQGRDFLTLVIVG